jgi:predicted peroxiredoxin
MAAAAAATNRAVTLFFTMAATRALLGRQGDGAPGWSALAPAADGSAATARDQAHGERGIATLEELLSACVEMGVQFRVCEMGLKAEAIDAADLREDVPVIISGIVGFLGDVSGAGEMLFI